MKFAEDIRKNKELKRQQLQKEHIEKVNEELLEIEKAQNTYETDLENINPYIDIQMIIKTQEAKDSLREHGFYIDKVNQDIPYGTTRVYLDETSYNIATRRKENSFTSKEEIKNKAYEELTKSCLKTPHTEDEQDERLIKLLEDTFGCKNFKVYRR